MTVSAVFLDRDGVLNPDFGYTYKVQGATLFADVLPSLQQLSRSGFRLVVVSNQSGVGRGMYRAEDVDRFHERLRSILLDGGVTIPASHFYFCPHTPADSCTCRKPAPGMLLAAAHNHELDLRASYLIGDKETDIKAGRAAGVTTTLLNRSGGNIITEADYFSPSLIHAAHLILSLASYPIL